MGGIEHVCFIKMARSHIIFSLEKIVYRITTIVVQNVCYFNLFGCISEKCDRRTVCQNLSLLITRMQIQSFLQLTIRAS